jgi:DNA invertase Pin-like site-specific DNA recombinase
MNTTNRHPVAYIRRSKKGERVEDQIAAVMTLVHRDGHNGDTTVYNDNGRSGSRAGLARRTAWADMNDAIGRGDVSAVYMRVLDRSGRDLEEWLRFLRVATDHGVQIIDETGVRSDPANKDSALFEMWRAERERDADVNRARFRTERQRARGDALGLPPYGSMVARADGGRVIHAPNPAEDVTAVVEAFNRAGTMYGATRLLNSDPDYLLRAPARHAMWSGVTVGRILRRAGALTMAPRKRGPLNHHAWTFFRLLVCPHCGTRMVAINLDHPKYLCPRAGRDPNHPRPYSIAESRILPWVQSQVAGRAWPSWSDTIGGADVPDRAVVDEAFRRVGRAYAAGALTDDDFSAATVAHDEALATIAAATEVDYTPHRLNWTDPTATVNADLTTLIGAIRFDTSMHPVAIDWKPAPGGVFIEWVHDPAHTPDPADTSAARTRRFIRGED